MQVMCDSTAESDTQHDMERAHVVVSVNASVEQVYQTIKVNQQPCVHSRCSG